MAQRLIDANKLMPNAELKGQYDLVSARDITNQPTVDAIPIEFIRRFVTINPPSTYTTYMYGDEFFDEDSWCNDLLDQWREKNK